VACGPDLRDFDEVEAEFDKPTGQISQTTMPSFLSNGFDIERSRSISSPAAQFDTTNTLNFALSSASQALGSDKAFLVENCALDFKLTRSGEPEKIVVDCTASGNDPSGELVMKFIWDGSELAAIQIQFSSWCTEGSECIDGWIGFRSSTSGASGAGFSQSFLLVAKLDSTKADGSVETLDYSIRQVENSDGILVEILGYLTVDGRTESVVFSGSLTTAGGTLVVRGGNGSFPCTYAADGSSGECSASGSGGTFSWTVSA